MSTSIVHIADPHDELTAMLSAYEWRGVRAGQLQHGEIALVASRRAADKERMPSPELLAADLLAELKAHCNALSEPQRYHVVLIDEDREVMAQRLITVHPDAVPKPVSPVPALHSALMTGDSEVIALAIRQSEQAMAHNEAAWRMLGQSMKAAMGTLASQLDRQSQRCKELEERHWETMRLQEEMLSKKHERELAERKAERTARFRGEMVNRVMEVAPYAIAQLSGASMAGQLFDSFSEDELKRFAAVMKPEQRAIVYQMLEKAKRGQLAERILGSNLGGMAGQGPNDSEPVSLPTDPAAVFVELFGSLSTPQIEGLSTLAGSDGRELLQLLVSEAQRVISAAVPQEGEGADVLAQRAAPLLDSAAFAGFIALYRMLPPDKVQALLELATPRQAALLQHLVVLLVRWEGAASQQTPTQQETKSRKGVAMRERPLPQEGAIPQESVAPDGVAMRARTSKEGGAS